MARTRTLIIANEPRPGRTRGEVALGHYPVSVADLASVHGTFAAAGRHVARHFVVRTRSAYGRTLSGPTPLGRTAMSAAVAADVSWVLAGPMPDTAPSQVAERLKVGPVGERRVNRQAAFSVSVPTGHGGHVASAWCARYVPELSVVGWLGHDPPRALAEPDGQATTAVSGAMCRRVLADALAGRPVSALPAPANVGRTDVGNVPGTGGAPASPPAPRPTATTATPAATLEPSPSAQTTFPTGEPTPPPTPTPATPATPADPMAGPPRPPTDTRTVRS
jgi:membrane peptidoglycan carboxypeptidase